MADDKVTMTEVEARTRSGALSHCEEYLETSGVRGHIRNFTGVGGHPSTPTLLLETFGRKSGERRLAPLIYGAIGGEYVVVASKGGADVHPGWYWNLLGMSEVKIQIATQAFPRQLARARGSRARGRSGITWPTSIPPIVTTRPEPRGRSRW